jgi:predicted transcriptional regulator
MNAPLPTDGELSILEVLWERGPSTVRQVHEVLGSRQSTGYTTTLKLMQIMVGKGLLRRDESQRSHIYEAALAQAEAQASLVGSLVDKAFGGSASALVMRALATRSASDEELDEIRRILDAVERRP